MTILVTGAFGFVGLGILRHLADAHPQTEIVGADRDPPDAGAEAVISLKPNLAAATVDVTDRPAVRACLDALRPAFVVHAAALTPPDGGDRLATFDVNLGGTLNVLAAADRVGAARVVVASSSGVYAATPAVTRREDDAIDPFNAYAASKLAAEALAAHYRAIAVRIGPVYGPHEVARPSRPKISAIGQLAAALRAGRDVTLCGPDVARDWTYVDDIARGVDGLLRARTLRHRVYNLSAGRAEPLSAVGAVFARHGLAVRWKDDPAEADIAYGPADARAPLAIGRIAADTGFAPRHTLETGIAALVAARTEKDGA